MSRKKKTPTLTAQNLPNPARVRADQQRRRSHAAGFHTPRPRRGTRAQHQRQAVRDQWRSW